VCGSVFSCEVLDLRPGYICAQIKGKNARRLFQNEPGGHRHQRIPPSERKGRVHTSTVTVAILQEPTLKQLVINLKDLEYKTCRGSGAGGQHRNTTDSAVQLTHLPTKTSVRVEAERSQHLNKELALALLRARLLQQREDKVSSAIAKKRKNQIGSGMRGDKIRTYNFPDNRVTCHLTGKKATLKKVLRGDFSQLR